MKQTVKKIVKQIIPSPIVQRYKDSKQKKRQMLVEENFSDVIRTLKNTQNQQRMILIGTAVSGNLGDQAISIAEMEFLTSNFPNVEVIEIQQTLYTQAATTIKPLINNQDILFINGGGFLGTLWPIAENMARDIIQTFQKNRIIIFPQTIYFEESDWGKEELVKSIQVFQKHPDLTIFVRDKASLAFANENYIGGLLKDVHLVPDIVTSLNYEEPKLERKNIVFCLRRDKEKIDHSGLLSSIENYIKESANEYQVIYTDSVIDEELDMYNRNPAMDQIMSEFKEAKLVVTDRLHGMILSAISGTPCLAMNNLSGKVKGAYDWVSYLNYIEYIENKKNLEKQIDLLLAIENTSYENEEIMKYHQLITEAITK